jgi:hypothetical protein
MAIDVKKVYNDHQPIINSNVLGSVDNEAAHSFRFLLVQPADASGGLSQPKDGICTDVHGNWSAQMRAKDGSIFTVDFDPFNCTSQGVAEVEIFAVVSHRRYSTINLNQLLSVSTIHVPDADDVTDAALDDEHPTGL